jgi:hypothetical protein
MNVEFLNFLNLNFLSQGPSKSSLFSLTINDQFKTNNNINKEDFSLFIDKNKQYFKNQKKLLKQKLLDCNKNIEKREVIDSVNYDIEKLVTEITTINEKIFYHEKSEVKNDTKIVISNIKEIQNLLKKIDYTLNVDVIVENQFDNLLKNLDVYNTIFQERQVLYSNTEKFLLDNRLFFAQVFVNSFENHDYDIIFSIETLKNPDILIFLHGEVYNYLRNSIANKINFSLNNLRDDYVALFYNIKSLTVGEFLSKLDLINLRKEFMLDNKVFYYQYMSSYILDLIENFKLSEKKIINSIKFLVSSLESKKSIINNNFFTHQDVVDFCIKTFLEKKVIEVLKITNEELIQLMKQSITAALNYVENPIEVPIIKVPKKIAILFNKSYVENINNWKKQFLTKNNAGDLVLDDLIQTNNKINYNKFDYFEFVSIIDSDSFISESFFNEKIPFNKNVYSVDIKVKNSGLIGQEWNVQYSFFVDRYYKR